MNEEMKKIFEGQKESFKNGYESGWNACLDDIQQQMKNAIDGNKMILQYYGVKE